MPVIKFYNKLSPFQRVIAALFLGIFAGIFVGEPAGNLEIVGNVYIRLLQMTVLPTYSFPLLEDSGVSTVTWQQVLESGLLKLSW